MATAPIATTSVRFQPPWTPRSWPPRCDAPRPLPRRRPASSRPRRRRLATIHADRALPAVADTVVFLPLTRGAARVGPCPAAVSHQTTDDRDHAQRGAIARGALDRRTTTDKRPTSRDGRGSSARTHYTSCHPASNCVATSRPRAGVDGPAVIRAGDFSAAVPPRDRTPPPRGCVHLAAVRPAGLPGAVRASRAPR